MKNGDFLSVYGTDISPYPNNTKISERQGNLGNVHIYVSICQFIGCKSSNSNGGGICVISSTSSKMLLEKSIFEKCQVVSSNHIAGAIYFGSHGSCIISEICGYDCCASTAKSYQFDYIQCTSNDEYKNYLNDSSISHSVNENVEYSIGHHYGIVSLKGVNSSFNTCTYSSSCYSCSINPTDAYPVTCTFSFCSFANNKATKCRIIDFNCYWTKKEIRSCNIINNEQVEDSSTNGIIRSNGPCEIKNSCIIGNKAKYIFYQIHNLSTIVVNNCLLDSDVDSKKGPSVTITNKVLKAFTVHIAHLKTGRCEAELTATSPRKKERNVCTKDLSLITIRKSSIVHMITLIFSISFLTLSA